MKQSKKKIRILFCGYRDWAKEIARFIDVRFSKEIVITPINRPEKFEKIKNFSSYDLIFFVGWSWIINNNIIKNNICICLHPSPLPKYRGGSPIQNQIIGGEKTSAVTLFIMNERLDAGPIIIQKKFPLAGELTEVLSAMTDASKACFEGFLDDYITTGKIKSRPQDEKKATTYRRRSEEMSEITWEEIRSSTPRMLYDKIRCLQDPYPNAYIKCKDGKKLFITRAKK